MVATRQKQTLNGEMNKDIYINTEKGTNILAYNVVASLPACMPGQQFYLDIR